MRYLPGVISGGIYVNRIIPVDLVDYVTILAFYVKPV